MLRKKLTDEEIREIFFNSDEEVNSDSETSESDSDDELPPNLQGLENGDAGVGLQIYKMINLGSNVIVYKLKHCVLHFEVNMMTF